MTATLNALLQKTADWDKDERYMATSDLCAELQKDVKLDATMERRICAAVLKQLDEQSNDVQAKRALRLCFRASTLAQDHVPRDVHAVVSCGDMGLGRVP